MRNDKDVIRNDEGKLVFARDIKAGESFEMDLADVREIEELGFTEAPQATGDVPGTAMGFRKGPCINQDVGKINSETAVHLDELVKAAKIYVQQPPASTGLEALQEIVDYYTGGVQQGDSPQRAVAIAKAALANTAPKAAGDVNDCSNRQKPCKHGPMHNYWCCFVHQDMPDFSARKCSPGIIPKGAPQAAGDVYHSTEHVCAVDAGINTTCKGCQQAPATGLEAK